MGTDTYEIPTATFNKPSGSSILCKGLILRAYPIYGIQLRTNNVENMAQI
jgi:hypothetical protein